MCTETNLKDVNETNLCNWADERGKCYKCSVDAGNFTNIIKRLHSVICLTRNVIKEENSIKNKTVTVHTLNFWSDLFE